MPTLGLLEDDPLQRTMLQRILQQAHYEVHPFTTIQEMINALQRQSFDLFLLDWSLPDGTALEVIQQIRQRLGWQTPIVIQSIHDTEAQIVHALEQGANDYITKPIRVAELTARLYAQMRTSVTKEQEQELILPAGYYFNEAEHTFNYQHQSVRLTPIEYRLLIFLTRHSNELVSRQTLLDEVWLRPTSTDSRTVDTTIARIRNKLNELPHHPFNIGTVRGFGYRLSLVESSLPPHPPHRT
ncbi:DNA-binding response regulator [Ectothiorhodospiraceae bacterium BW-2]|nr:DNA-binding response regulator [Ectothiorhodospiraceae bacterium BW-2]